MKKVKQISFPNPTFSPLVFILVHWQGSSRLTWFTPSFWRRCWGLWFGRSAGFGFGKMRLGLKWKPRGAGWEGQSETPSRVFHLKRLWGCKQHVAEADVHWVTHGSFQIGFGCMLHACPVQNGTGFQETCGSEQHVAFASSVILIVALLLGGKKKQFIHPNWGSWSIHRFAQGKAVDLSIGQRRSKDRCLCDLLAQLASQKKLRTRSFCDALCLDCMFLLELALFDSSSHMHAPYFDVHAYTHTHTSLSLYIYI